MGPHACLAVLATVGSMAPQLSDLHDFDYDCNAQHAGMIARTMPNLQSLTIGGSLSGRFDEDALASAWEALPGRRLTSLDFRTVVPVPRQLFKTACWPKLRYLRGILLPGECAAALARGLPSLEALDAVLDGEWAGAGGAVFGRVRQARLQECCASFVEHARISSLLPSIERLSLSEDQGTISTDLAGATRLTHLRLGDHDLLVNVKGQPRAWAALCTRPACATWPSM